MIDKTVLRRFLPHAIALLCFVLLSSIYFLPELSGKRIKSGDDVEYRAQSKELRTYREKTGRTILWTNSMFGGMPTYHIEKTEPNNKLRRLVSLSRMYPILGKSTGYFFAAMLCFYLMMISLRASVPIAAISSVAFAFATNNLVLFEAGHNAKLAVISYLPLMVAGMIRTYRSNYVSGGLIFGLAVGLVIYANHPQMSYYYLMSLPFFLIPYFVRSLKNGKIKQFAIASAVLVVMGFIGLGASTSLLWTTYEYQKQTIRGGSILSSDVASKEDDKGLDFDYATQWSNGWLDLMASFVPGVAGGASSERVGKGSATYKFLKKRTRLRSAEIDAPLYWGKLPFTSGPIYFGVVTGVLFLMAMVLLQGPLKWWSLGAFVLTLLLSLGHNFPLYRWFYDFLPMFNKFRTPNSVLSVTILFLPLAGYLALHRIFKGKFSKIQVMKSLYVAGVLYGGVSLFFLLAGPSFFDFSSSQDARLAQAGWDLSVLVQDRKAFMRSDALRTLLLVLLTLGLIWAYLQKKIKPAVLLSGLALLTLGDLWSVGKRYLNEDNYVKSSKYKNIFKQREVDREILKDKDLSYRVLDLSVNTFNTAMPSYFHKTIGGYHAAKLRRYQDLIEGYITKGHSAVLNMLNTRYVITGKQGDEKLQRNPDALGNAWFVKDISRVSTADEEFGALDRFNPAATAILHEEYASYLSGLNTSGSGTIRLTDYAPDHLVYQSKSNGEQLAVFSEIWYGPNLGWQAYIDGEAVEHIRANYALRALRVPPGNHKVEFIFKPRSYFTGRIISLVCSMLLLVLAGGYLMYRFLAYRRGQSVSK